MKHVLSSNMNEELKVLVFDDATNTAEWVLVKTADDTKKKFDFATAKIKE